MAPVHRGIRNRRTASSVTEFASNLGNPLDGYGYKSHKTEVTSMRPTLATKFIQKQL